MFGNIDAKIEKLAQRGKSIELAKMLDHAGMANSLKIIPLLGQIGDDKAVNALISYLGVKNQDIRIAAVKALGATGDQTAKSHLQHLVQVEKDEKVLDVIRQAITEIPLKG